MKQRRNILAMMFAVLFVIACTGIAPAEEVMKIENADQLIEFGRLVNEEEKTTLDAVLVNDIDLTGVEWSSIGMVKPFTAYGTQEQELPGAYNGTFDGAGHTIRGLEITPAGVVNGWYGRAAGLFGVTGVDAVIKNVTVEHADIQLRDMDGHVSAGAIAGLNQGMILDCTVLGGVFSTTEDSGAIVGQNAAGVITNCVVTSVDRVAGYNAGGIAGQNQGKVTGCTVKGLLEISGDNGAGGVAGYNESEITDCTAEQIGTIDGEYAGGVVGDDYGGTIRNCAAVRGKNVNSYFTGGVVGQSYGGTITNCVANGIDKISGFSAGGVAGYSYGAQFTNCAARNIGEVTGKDDIGGIIGWNEDGRITSCLADGIGKISGSGDVGGVAGYSNGKEAAVTNCAVIGIAEIAGKNVGGVVGHNNGGTITNALLFKKETEAQGTTLLGAAHEGGVLGNLAGGEPNVFQITNSRYPSNLFFTNYEDKPIGNVDLDLGELQEQYNVASYDVTENAALLPAIVALIEQGVSVTVKKGSPYPLDVTTLPGMSGDVTFAWSSENESVANVTPSDGPFVTLTGMELGTAKVTCVISGKIEAELSCAVKVVEAAPDPDPDPNPNPDPGTDPNPVWQKDSSNCASLPGAAFVLTLFALPFVKRKK